MYSRLNWLSKCSSRTGNVRNRLCPNSRVLHREIRIEPPYAGPWAVQAVRSLHGSKRIEGIHLYEKVANSRTDHRELFLILRRGNSHDRLDGVWARNCQRVPAWDAGLEW